MARPKINSEGEKELEKVDAQFQDFDKNVKDLTLDAMNKAPKLELEPVHKISQKEIENTGEIYLKPIRTIGSKEKFNEDYRKDYEFAKEYVKFIPENKEIIGETIELWTKPFAGMPAEMWKIPTGKPVWAPRYVAERIKGCTYHRLIMQPTQTNADGMGSYFGNMIADTVIQRLDALPVSTKKSIFMGANT